jgi:hypothetical protein
LRLVSIAAAVGWLLAILLGAAVWVQSARHESASTTLEHVAAARDSNAQSAAAWKAAFEKVKSRLDQQISEREVDRRRDRDAVAAAQAAKRDADATLDAWMDRYAAATRSAECAAIERLPICEVPE